MRFVATLSLALVVVHCASGFAAEAGVVSQDAIEAALLDRSSQLKPAEMKTRGLKLQARSEESRGAIDLQIAFALSSAALLPEAQGQLRELAGALKSPRLAGQKFELAGHTDASGTAAYNRQLSLARATTVRDYLAKAGVDTTAMTVAGYGPDRPLAGKDPNSAENRRVEIRTREAQP